ncbi:MAG: chorismate synthase [Ruthenibacterium sp.]
MRDTFGNAISLTLFGESHGPAIGAVLHGVAAGVPVDEAFMAAQMDLRRAKGALSTKRTEADAVRLLSGVQNGRATGTAITLEILNTNTKSADYATTQALLRPGHADYTAQKKYGGFQDARGGGHFSGRLTAPLVAAGSIFTALLRQKGVVIGTHLSCCAGVADASFAPCPCGDNRALQEQLLALNAREFAVLDADAGEAMAQAIAAAAQDGDSVGGVLETAIVGLPAGLGEPFFTSVESELSSLLFSMPAVKGIEFGAGFAFAALRGSAANDALRMAQGEGSAQDAARSAYSGAAPLSAAQGECAPRAVTVTNNNGGINGGITNGMPVIFRTVIKPTPSIYQPQDTVDWAQKRDAVLQIHGRHDPCIAHRARVVQDSLAALALADLCTMAYGVQWQQEDFAWNTV